MAAWITRMGTMQRTGSVHNRLAPPLSLRWKAGLRGSAYLWNSPTISEDGIVYMTLRTKESNPVTCLHGLRLDNGSVLWYQPAVRVDMSGAATISQDVVFATDMYVVYCLDRFSGIIRWQYPVPSLISNCAPALTENLVYVGCSDGHIYSLDATTGQLVWQFATDHPIQFTPSVAGSILYTGIGRSNTQPTALVALATQTGEVQWKHEFPYGIHFGYNATVAVEYELVLAALQRYGLCALATSTGQLVWRYELDYGPWTAPCIDNHIVYVAGSGLHAVDSLSGTALWSTKSYRLHNSAPIVTEEFVFIGGGHANRIYAFDRRNGQNMWQFETGDLVFSTPAIADDKLLIGCHDGYLYCLEQT